MICGHCKRHFSHVQFLIIHWKQFGCPWGRDVWERVVEARRRGHSGRRLLHARWPHLWPSEPMPPEVREKMQELAAQRKLERSAAAKARRRIKKLTR